MFVIIDYELHLLISLKYLNTDLRWSLRMQSTTDCPHWKNPTWLHQYTHCQNSITQNSEKEESLQSEKEKITFSFKQQLLW